MQRAIMSPTASHSGKNGGEEKVLMLMTLLIAENRGSETGDDRTS